MPTDFLQHLNSQVKERFLANRNILSFGEYFELVRAAPALHARGVAQYLKAVFEHFGQESVRKAYGTETRYKLFDQSFAGKEGQVVGQERVQEEIYKTLCNFARIGRVNKLIVLHGPNGSAKSSIVRAMMAAMEAFSKLDQGVLYRFNWVFPSDKLAKSGIGFADRAAASSSKRSQDGSFARLAPDQIDARISGGISEHPLFLIPTDERARLIESWQQSGALPEDFVISDYIRCGELGKKSRAIYDALLTAYDGDYGQVLNHIQIERFYPSRRYSTACVTIEPQMSVDAGVQQITADKSLGALPKSLANVDLFHPYGPLVDANRGILEFADILKRPVESFKYLLGTVETATVSLGGAMLHLDQLLIASTNDKYLEAFKEHPDFPSFKGRMELIKVPYLRLLSDEIAIYQATMTERSLGRHIAPHAIETACLWAVLTRLKKPNGDRHPRALADIVDKLTPLEKLRLYNGEGPPQNIGDQAGKELMRIIPELYDESQNHPYYEGARGASAREVRTILLNAAHRSSLALPDGHLSAFQVLEEIRAFIGQKSVYDFLRDDAVQGFHDPVQFAKIAETALLDAIDEELRASMGLTSEHSHDELFARYVTHVSHWVKRERLLDRVTGKLVDPDENFMREIEQIMTPPSDDPIQLRHALIGQIGAYSLEHPTTRSDSRPDYAQLFPSYLKRLEDHFFASRAKQIERVAHNFLKYQAGERSALSPKEIEQVESTLQQMISRYGYKKSSAQEAISFALRRRIDL